LADEVALLVVLFAKVAVPETDSAGALKVVPSKVNDEEVAKVFAALVYRIVFAPPNANWFQVFPAPPTRS